MKGSKLFLPRFDPWDERPAIGLPPDATIPLPTWACLSATSRSAYDAAEILLAVADIQATLAADAAAHLRWIEPALARVADDARRLPERLAC